VRSISNTMHACRCCATVDRSSFVVVVDWSMSFFVQTNKSNNPSPHRTACLCMLAWLKEGYETIDCLMYRFMFHLIQSLGARCCILLCCRCELALPRLLGGAATLGVARKHQHCLRSNPSRLLSDGWLLSLKGIGLRYPQQQ
jgi:hypothetical protein